MNCPTCKGPMRPLLTSWFCPKDCDRMVGSGPTRPGPPFSWVKDVSADATLWWEVWVAPGGSTVTEEQLRPFERAWWYDHGELDLGLSNALRGLTRPGWMLDDFSRRNVVDVLPEGDGGIILFRRKT